MSTTIFHGNNLKYIAGPEGTAFFPQNWTTSARQALGFAYSSAENYSANMVVFALPDFPKDHFKKVDLNVFTREEVEWYQIYNELSQEQKNKVETYNEQDLERFVNKYFSKEDFYSLLAMKYRDRVLSKETLEKHKDYGNLA